MELDVNEELRDDEELNGDNEEEVKNKKVGNDEKEVHIYI